MYNNTYTFKFTKKYEYDDIFYGYNLLINNNLVTQEVNYGNDTIYNEAVLFDNEIEIFEYLFTINKLKLSYYDSIIESDIYSNNYILKEINNDNGNYYYLSYNDKIIDEGKDEVLILSNFLEKNFNIKIEKK